MPRTSNVFSRIEPELKEQAENILAKLGISMGSAIGMFLRQVVLQRGIPFEVRLPHKKPAFLCELTPEKFDAEIEKGFADIAAGRVRSAEDVFAALERDYGI
jgi:addiction module RelB/DinJ family antitoxin